VDSEQRPQTGQVYRAWTASTAAVDAVAAFVRRYNCQPEQCFVWKRLLWVGPVPGERGE